MTILAKTRAGKEFLYNAASARKVSKASAQKICDIVNENGFLLKDGELWHIYNIDKYDTAYNYANFQSFTIRKGIVTARAY